MPFFPDISDGGVGSSQSVSRIASQRAVHAAFRWMHLNSLRMMQWQTELVSIPAPPFGEAARSKWLAERFFETGLDQVHTDEAGNVLAFLANPADGLAGPVVALSAHLDTVFPADTPINPLVSHERIEAPGACDNAAGVIGMLALAHAMKQAGITAPVPILFVGNVGEEGEGDLRGVRHLYKTWRGRIAAHVVLDGAGEDVAVTQALGSRRYRIRVTGPGGHSFTDSGTPNPIVTLGAALAALADVELPISPRTTLNVGTIQGGSSVNSIPELAVATVDFRSTDPEQLVRLEVLLHRVIEDAVDAANERAARKKRDGLTYFIECIGDRPAGWLAPGSPLMDALRAVDRHLGIRTDMRLGSTDANLPLSLGVPAVSLGAGGEGGGAHTRGEWYSAANREFGLRRVLMLMLSMAEWAASL